MKIEDYKLRDEAELESILISNPSYIEKDFKVLSNQRSTNKQKRLDIIGVDINGTFTIIELKVATDENQLVQALGYYTWVMEQGLDWFSSAYGEKLGNYKIEDNMPQIFLIAPDFAESTKNQVKYIRSDITIRLFTYTALSVDEKVFIKLKEEPVIPLKGIVEKPWNIEDNYAYINNEMIKNLFKASQEKVKNIAKDHIEEKVGKLVVSYWINGIKFCEFYPKKEYLAVGFKTDEVDSGWSWQTEIYDEKAFDEILETKIKYAYNLMKKKKGK